jgi:acyl-CoA thioesterase
VAEGFASAPGAGLVDTAQRAASAGTFDRDTAVRRLESAGPDGRTYGVDFTAELSPHWCINGRPHGGYLAAIIMRALLQTVADAERAPRSLTIHFLRPPRPGEVRIAARTERSGGSLSTLSARMEQNGEAVALALSAFSLARASLELDEQPMPDVAAPDPERQMSAVLLERIERGLAPPFLGNLVIQPRQGAVPFAGSDAPLELSAWLGLAEVGRPLDAIALALFSDALFPTPFPRLTEPAGAPTIDLTVHFREGAALTAARDPAELCLAQFRSGLIHEGFFEEDGVIWAADGTVLAQSRQLALLIAPAAI